MADRSDHMPGAGETTHRAGELLVEDPSVAAVVRHLEQSPRPPARQPEPLEGLGVTRLVLGGEERTWPVPEIVRRLRAEGLGVAPNRLLYGRSHVNVRPAVPPTPSDPLPSLNREGEVAGHGVRVGVVDSGVWPEHPWLAGQVELGSDHDREASPDGTPRPDDVLVEPDQEPKLRYYAGHGTFIAGTVLQHAPGATIVARRIFRDGHVDDVELSRQLLAMADVDILTLSLGTRPTLLHGHDEDDPVEDMEALLATSNALIELRRRNPDLIVLAPAGNEGSSDRIWPAAFTSVIAVAGLDVNAEDRAPFSNFGPWVDCCARAAGSRGPFLHWHGNLQPPSDEHHTRDGGHGELLKADFDGWATWSGTSFATPRVAGALAALMGEGMDAGTAVATVLRRPGLRSVPGCGVVVDPPLYLT